MPIIETIAVAPTSSPDTEETLVTNSPCAASLLGLSAAQQWQPVINETVINLRYERMFWLLMIIVGLLLIVINYRKQKA